MAIRIFAADICSEGVVESHSHVKFDRLHDHRGHIGRRDHTDQHIVKIIDVDDLVVGIAEKSDAGSNIHDYIHIYNIAQIKIKVGRFWRNYTSCKPEHNYRWCGGVNYRVSRWCTDQRRNQKTASGIDNSSTGH